MRSATCRAASRKPNECWAMRSAVRANRTVESATLLRDVMPVPILKQGTILIATVQAALTDSDTQRLRYDLMEHVSRFRAHGIIVDLTAIDVMDSYAARSLRTIAHMTRLRGADTVIVGLQPEVAFAMVQLGLVFDDMYTALDLEEGLAFLNRQLESRQPTNGRDGDE